MDADDLERHKLYIKTADSGGYQRYLLTLLAQRRELQTDSIQKLLLHSQPDDVSIPNEVDPANLLGGALLPGASNLTIDTERQALQQELSVGLECNAELSSAESIRKASDKAGNLFERMDDAAALKMHFKGRVAAIACEKRQLAEHIKLLQNEHLQHMAERSIPEDVTAEKFHRQIGDLQMPHAGAAHHGRCQCTGEIRLGGQCMQALYLAEADTHARLARLQSAGGGKRMIEDADWAVALNHAVSLGPGGRLGKRLKDRLEMLTYSHHHRFPIYEMVAGAAQQRDHQMASAGLRVPPRVVRSMAEAEAIITEYFDEFEADELMDEAEEDAQSVVSSKRSSRAGGSVLGTMPSARTAGVGGSMAKTVVTTRTLEMKTQHKSAYIARKMLPRVVAKQRLRWPGATSAPDFKPSTSIGQNSKLDPQMILTEEQQQRLEEEEAGASTFDQIHMHEGGDMGKRLETLVPSIIGDESFGHAATMRGKVHVDEHMRADNEFLDSFKTREVGQRLRRLSQLHVDKWSSPETDDLQVGVLSVANKDKGDDVLEDKTMEALYFMRFIKTKRSKLKVLHYMNAIVSMQLTLLGDEELERDAVDSLSHTTSAKEFTCPMQYAASIRTKDDHRNAKDTPSVPSQRPSGGVKWDVDDNEADAVAEAAAASVELPDVWCDDQEAGVAVRQKEGKWVLYRQSIDMFRNLEEELLRVGTHYLEQYCGQLHMVGKEEEEQEIDRATILEDLWSFESQFCEAKHKLMVAYLQAYRHAEADSPLDEWTADRPTPFNADGNAKWSQLNSNTPQPHHLSARVQLRREMLDLCFRRPQFALEDGYFAGRYINATVCLDMEANLVAQLSSAVAKQERQALTNMFMSAARAHAAEEHGEVFPSSMDKLLPSHSVWQPGYPAAVVYGGVLATTIHRGLMQEGGFLPSVGAAVAQIPAILRKLVSDFAEVHQICHFVELSELRRVIVQHACVEMNLLQSEEAYRQLAVPDKPPPKDSKIKDSLGRGNDDAVAIAQANWLCTSLVADNPAVVAMAAVEAGASPKNALEAVLLREDIIRRLYRTEVLWIVYCCQSRALGKNVKHAEMAAIDWDGLDQQGNPTKPELKKEVVVDCEPSDIDPPGFAGPHNSVTLPGGSGAGMPGIMMAVGRSGLIGGVWRVPPLALSEFTTSPSELLQPHSLTALKALMSQDSLQMKTLRAASQAQSLREIAFHTSTTHNQILLDFVIRKLDRRRRVLMWRTAAMEGDTDESTMDVCIGGPPGQYAPSAYEPTNNIYHSVVPPLLKEPAKARMQTYQQKRRHSRTQGTKGGKSRSRASSFSSSMDGGEEQIELLDARSQGDFKESRKMLTEAVSPLWLDVHDIKLSLRKQARQNFVENLRIALRAPGGSQGGAGHGTASGANQGGAGHGTAGGANSAGAVTNEMKLENIKIDIFDSYCKKMTELLLPGALKADISTAVRQMALLLLGGSGGFGQNWGLKFTPDGRRLMQRAEVSPFFSGAEGVHKLHRLLLEYGPLWQAVDFAAADKQGDPDPMTWNPIMSAIPPGFMFQDTNKDARLDQLWEIPCQLDVLAIHCYGSSSEQIPPLQEGFELSTSILGVMTSALTRAALLAPSAHLAKGGDVCKPATDTANTPGSHLNETVLKGEDLYHHVAHKAEAANSAFLPGALMAPALVQLHSRMQFLIKPKGIAGTGGAVPQKLVPVEKVLAYLRGEKAINGYLFMLAATRTRDTMLGGGSGLKASRTLVNWSLMGSVEYGWARGMAVPEERAPLLQAAALRIPDADRVAMFNEMSRLQLMMERALEDCALQPTIKPIEAQALCNYLLAAIWVHDRLRDACAWRALLMEHPEKFPYTPYQSQYLRRFHDQLLFSGAQITPQSVRVFMEDQYSEKVVGQADALVVGAKMLLQMSGGKAAKQEEHSSRGTNDSAGAEPSWLLQSPAWGSVECCAIEAAIVAMKQILDLQAIQVALLRLHKDCAELTGLQAAASTKKRYPGSKGVTLMTKQSQDIVAPIHTSSTGPIHPALVSLVRKLTLGKKQGMDGSTTFVVQADEMARWLVEAIAQISVDSRAAMDSLSRGAASERHLLFSICNQLESSVTGLAQDLDSFMRHHAMKVDTQMVDKAVSLLMELNHSRRAAMRSLEDAKNATERAYMQAQSQYSAKIDSLERDLLVCQTNAQAMRSDIQKEALSALIDIRHEALSKAFGRGGSKAADNRLGGGGLSTMLRLEKELENSQMECLDMHRVIVKVQSWFKIRSSAFQTACMREVTAAREKALELEAWMWENRERSELAIEQLQRQLKATQRDLQVVSSTLSKSSLDLNHALASNKRLLQWKISTQPRVEALRNKISEITKNREAWLEWVGSKAGLMQQVTSVLMRDQGQTIEDTESWDQQRRELRAELAALRRQLQEERTAKTELFEKLMMVQQQQHQQRFGSPGKGPPSPTPNNVAAAGGHNLTGVAAPLQLDVVTKKLAKLQKSHDQVTDERDMLQRTIAAIRMAAPELVDTFMPASNILAPVPGDSLPRDISPSDLPGSAPDSPMGHSKPVSAKQGPPGTFGSRLNAFMYQPFPSPSFVAEGVQQPAGPSFNSPPRPQPSSSAPGSSDTRLNAKPKPEHPDLSISSPSSGGGSPLHSRQQGLRSSQVVRPQSGRPLNRPGTGTAGIRYLQAGPEVARSIEGSLLKGTGMTKPGALPDIRPPSG